jgi:hypothetical protein
LVTFFLLAISSGPSGQFFEQIFETTEKFAPS